MKAFKIVLGIIVMAVGLGMAAAGCALFAHGNLGAVFNAFWGGVLLFFGAGAVYAGVMLLRGDRVRDALGGIVTATPGHSGVGLRQGDVYDPPPSNFGEVLQDVFMYTVLAIVVVLIAIFSIFRANGGFPFWLF